MWGGWWKKQTRRVCGAVSPDLSLQVHSRVFDLAVKPACVLFYESPKGRESVLSTRPTSEAKQYVDITFASQHAPAAHATPQPHMGKRMCMCVCERERAEEGVANCKERNCKGSTHQEKELITIKTAHQKRQWIPIIREKPYAWCMCLLGREKERRSAMMHVFAWEGEREKECTPEEDMHEYIYIMSVYFFCKRAI